MFSLALQVFIHRLGMARLATPTQPRARLLHLDLSGARSRTRALTAKRRAKSVTMHGHACVASNMVSRRTASILSARNGKKASREDLTRSEMEKVSHRIVAILDWRKSVLGTTQLTIRLALVCRHDEPTAQLVAWHDSGCSKWKCACARDSTNHLRIPWNGAVYWSSKIPTGLLSAIRSFIASSGRSRSVLSPVVLRASAPPFGTPTANDAESTRTILFAGFHTSALCQLYDTPSSTRKLTKRQAQDLTETINLEMI